MVSIIFREEAAFRIISPASPVAERSCVRAAYAVGLSSMSIRLLRDESELMRIDSATRLRSFLLFSAVPPEMHRSGMQEHTENAIM